MPTLFVVSRKMLNTNCDLKIYEFRLACLNAEHDFMTEIWVMFTQCESLKKILNIAISRT